MRAALIKTGLFIRPQVSFVSQAVVFSQIFLGEQHVMYGEGGCIVFLFFKRRQLLIVKEVLIKGDSYLLAIHPVIFYFWLYGLISSYGRALAVSHVYIANQFGQF